MRVRCIRKKSGRVQHELTVRAQYEVIGIEAGDLRVINDGGAPCLYSRRLFKVIDRARPADWAVAMHDGVEYAYSPALARPGFFEDYFAKVPTAVRTFHRYVNRHLRLTEAA